MASISESDGVGDGGIKSKSSSVKLEAKVWEDSSISSVKEMEKLPLFPTLVQNITACLGNILIHKTIMDRYARVS